MSRIAILGATGSLGSHVAQSALRAGHDVSVLVRTPSKLQPEIATAASITTGDLMSMPLHQLSRFMKGHQALICCAGLVTEGQRFVDLVARVISAVESLDPSDQPICWFLAGAGLLEIDDAGRMGLDLPKVRTTYWPHRANYEQLLNSCINWQLLCPGPMVARPGLGLDQLRVSTEKTPVHLPGFLGYLPKVLALPFFAAKIPEMIISYEDAAALILANLEANSPFLRKRVGLALPIGMRGHKDRWGA